MTKRHNEPKDDNMRVRYTVRVNSDDNKSIDDYCKKTGKSRSDVIREAVMKLIRDGSR